MAYKLPEGPVPIYLGTKAILARVGYRSPKMLITLIRDHGLPCYKRLCHTKTTRYRAWAASESAITAWELTQGALSTRKLQAKREAQRSKGKYALAG